MAVPGVHFTVLLPTTWIGLADLFGARPGFSKAAYHRMPESDRVAAMVLLLSLHRTASTNRLPNLDHLSIIRVLKTMLPPGRPGQNAELKVLVPGMSGDTPKVSGCGSHGRPPQKGRGQMCSALPAPSLDWALTHFPSGRAAGLRPRPRPPPCARCCQIEFTPLSLKVTWQSKSLSGPDRSKDRSNRHLRDQPAGQDVGLPSRARPALRTGR